MRENKVVYAPVGKTAACAAVFGLDEERASFRL